MTTTWMLAAMTVMAAALGGCMDGGGGDDADDGTYTRIRIAEAPAATFHDQITACVATKNCDPLCLAVFDLGPDDQIKSCTIESRDLAGATVKLIYTGIGSSSSPGDVTVGFGEDGDDDGYEDGSDDGSDNGSDGDGSDDGSDDGSASGSDDGGDSGDSGDGGDDGDSRKVHPRSPAAQVIRTAAATARK